MASRSRDLGAILAAGVRDRSGSVGLLFAITSMVMMLIVAIAIDYGRTEHEYQRIQRAADSAALAASHKLGTPDQDTAGPDVAERFFRANIDGHSGEALESVELDATRGEVKVFAGGNIGTSLLNAFGVRSLEIKAASRVVKGDGTVEVALVLDNSGSMAGTYIADLKTAAQSLVNVVFAGAEQSERVTMAVVPFSGAVNVGAASQGSSWMDGDGIAPASGANFASNVPRFTMFDRLGVAWKGCVEARTGGYDVSDAPANPAQPDSMFVPMFAPDEPDSNNDGGMTYYNSYIADDGGACTPQPTTCTKYDRRGRCTQSQKVPLPPAEAQARICKYDGAYVPSGTDGPNYMCDTEPVQPLTSTKEDVVAKIASLVAKGSTNIPEGLMWGWRVLSPAEPFAEGRAYDAHDNQKVIVLMTDGENTYSAYSNHNKSWYAAHGYGAAGRLGTTYTSTAYTARMNQKLTTACANAKAQGIKIYTVAFRLESDPTTTSLLQSCATEASMAFRAADGATLVSAFQRIGTEISKLRVAG
ncbi:MAG: pilus assembly protein TadG-related protein [Hyphomicrobiaceae bacterium]